MRLDYIANSYFSETFDVALRVVVLPASIWKFCFFSPPICSKSQREAPANKNGVYRRNPSEAEFRRASRAVLRFLLPRGRQIISQTSALTLKEASARRFADASLSGGRDGGFMVS